MQSLRKLSKQSVASAQPTTRRGVCHGIIGKHLRDFWPKWKWMKLQGVVFLSRASSASCFVWKVFLHMHVHMSHHSLSFYQKHQDRVLRQWGVMVWGKRGGEKKGGRWGAPLHNTVPPTTASHTHAHTQTDRHMLRLVPADIWDFWVSFWCSSFWLFESILTASRKTGIP